MESLEPTFWSIFLDRLISVFLALVAAILAGIFTILFFYLIVIYFRLKKREQISLEMLTLEVKLPKENEIKIDAADQMFSAFSLLKKSGFFSFLDVDDVLAFEIVGKKADIRFYVSAPSRLIDLVEKTIYGYYPQADIKQVDEPNIFTEEGQVAFAGLTLKEADYYPIKVYKDLPTDPLAAITSALSKMDDKEGAIVQVLIRPASGRVKKNGFFICFLN